MKQYIDGDHIDCPSCGKHNFTDIRQLNLMFKPLWELPRIEEHSISSSETAQGNICIL